MTEGKSRGPSRRQVLNGLGVAGAALAMPSVITSRARAAAGTLVVRDAGGLYTEAATAGYYKPFTEATGIEIVPVSATTDPLAQVKAMVDAKSYTWDVVLNRVGGAELLGGQGYLEEIVWSGGAMDELIPRAHSKYLMGTDVYSSVYGYRTDVVKADPQGWADFFDVEKYPGRRAMSKNAIDTLEEALLADGVEPDKLYPLDIDRALRKLDTIRDSIAVWWSSGAQSSQLLNSGEADFVASWNGRVQAAIDEGAPARLVWRQALYGVEGWTIPKGNPKAELGQKFIAFCADPQRQADFAKVISYGPTNPAAFDYLPGERALVLPTYPGHFDELIYQDHAYWQDNQEAVLEKFNAWLLQ